MPNVDHIHRASRLVTEQNGERNIFGVEDHLRELAVQVVLDPACSKSHALEAALLTIVNAGHRTLLGGIHVVNPPNTRTITPLGMGEQLPDVVRALGGHVTDRIIVDMPVIAVGPRTPSVSTSRGVRVEVHGWTAGVVPVADSPVFTGDDALPIAGVLGGALAVSEIFAAAMGLHHEACDRQIGLSLWELDPTRDWRSCAQGPGVRALPANLWLVGLGHLGQAYLWAQSSLSYRKPADVEIWLQDDDRIEQESNSTGLLVNAADLGRMKTRVAASRMEAAGFRTRLFERRLTGACPAGDDAPRLLLGGVDSPSSRLAIAQAIASDTSSLAVIDVGLGAQPADFDQLLLHSSPFTPRDLDRLREAGNRTAERARRTAETKLFEEIATASGLDSCGVVRLAEIAVGVPYVGAAAGAIVIGEVLRRLAGARAIKTLGIDLRNPHFGAPPLFHDSTAHRIAFVDAA